MVKGNLRLAAGDRLHIVMQPGDGMTVSVVIPVKNRPALLRRAVESVQAQTLPVAEIVVVDDGSTDGTPAVLDAMAASDPRIRAIRLDASGGAANARNIGIDASSGDWVAFLDSDDAWVETKLERQMARVSADPSIVACFTGIRYISDDPLDPRPVDYLPPPHFGPDLLRRMNYLSSTSTALIRRSELDAVGGFDVALRSCQDWDLWLKIARRGALAVVREPLLLYTQSSGDRISRNYAAVMEGHRTVFARALEGVGSGLTRFTLAGYHHLRLAELLLWDFGRPGEAVGHLARSLAHRPTRHALFLFRHAVIRSLRNMGERGSPRPASR